MMQAQIAIYWLGSKYGFLIVQTSLSAVDVTRVTDMYRQFFHLPEAEKAHVSMAKTGSNHGGVPRAVNRSIKCKTRL